MSVKGVRLGGNATTREWDCDRLRWELRLPPPRGFISFVASTIIYILLAVVCTALLLHQAAVTRKGVEPELHEEVA